MPSLRRAAARVAESLEPRRLLAVFLHDEGVGVPDNPLFYPYANFLYFSGGAPDAVGLWENNGGPGLTHIAFGSFPGPASYDPDSIALLTNPQLPTYQDKYVTGDHAQGGRALYRRNEFNGAETVVARFASIGQLNVLDPTTIVFVADGSDGAGEELWRTDGTPAGTVRISDINPGPAGAAITGLTPMNRTVVFSADDGTHGAELWASDGTAAGTRLAMDINPGPAGSGPRDFMQAGTRLTFNATTPQYGSELWATGFGAVGTALVVDAYPGPASSGMTAAISPAGAEFYAFTRGDAPLELYRIDQNPAQLTLIKHISDEPAGDRLIRPVRLKDSGGSSYQVFLFGASDEASGLEPWRSDGTREGTYLIRDVNPGPADSMAADASIASIWGNRAFFAATGPGGPTGVPVLWTTTGTAAGTHAAAAPDGQLAYRPTNVVDAYRNAFFAASATPDAGAARTLWIARQDAPVYRITGNVYHDRNANGVREGADVGVRGVTVYADLDGDSSPDPDEPSVVTGDEFGFYSLSVPAGTYTVRVVPPPGYFM